MQFAKLAQTFEELENTPSRLDMMVIVAKLYQEVGAADAKMVTYLLQGQLAPPFRNLDLGMGENFVIDAIAKVTGFSDEEVKKKYKSVGDLGEVAQELIGKKKQGALFSQPLPVGKVYENLLKIATSEGKGSQEGKIRLLSELFNSANPIEAKFLVRIPMGQMRLGVGDPTIMDAWALNASDEFRNDYPKVILELESELKEKKEEKRKEELNRKVRQKVREQVEAAYNIHSDLGDLAQALAEKGLKGLAKIEITQGIPIRPAMAERLPTAAEIVEKIGKCAVEGKLDGFRLQVHKDGSDVRFFSRHGEDMTNMVPELVDAIRKQVKSKRFIGEGEAIAFDETTGSFFPFQVTMQRKRKYDVVEKSKEFPLQFFLFDVMMDDGKNVMAESFEKRRARLKSLLKEGDVVFLTKNVITDDPKEIELFFHDNVTSGLEGVMCKDLNAPYTAGGRKFAWIKLKRSYQSELQDSIDCVVVGFYKGKGKRAQFGLGGLLVAVWDENEERLKTIAKIGTGMTEAELTHLEETLSKKKLNQKPKELDSNLIPDVWVKPEMVLEIRADEITKSPIHTCGWNGVEGLALRFPRLITIRTDKVGTECSTVKEAQDMFKMQGKKQVVTPTDN